MFSGGSVGAEFNSAEKGGDAQRTKGITGGPLPNGGGPPNSRESMQVNMEARVSSIQECALTDTLEEVRILRDKILIQDACSNAGLALAQIALILQRVECGISSGRESFHSLTYALASKSTEKAPNERPTSF